MAQRRCIICRKSEEKVSLLRFVLSGSAKVLTLDIEQNLPGRAAYCHARAGCVTARGLEGKLVRDIIGGSRHRDKAAPTIFIPGMLEVVDDAKHHYVKSKSPTIVGQGKDREAIIARLGVVKEALVNFTVCKRKIRL